MIIVAGCNEGYRDRFQGCVNALKTHANVSYKFVSVGYKGYTLLTHEQNSGSPPETECIQHGSFLKVIKGSPNDVIIYIDGDVIMQRPFNDKEMDWLKKFPANAVSATWNQIGETLEGCTNLIGRKVENLGEVWGVDNLAAPSLNVGVVVARRSTWEQSYNLYMQRWQAACDSFVHQARQQWLMCWTYSELKLNTQIMDWGFHAHGHFGLKPGMSKKADGVYVNGELAALRHYV